MEVIILKDAESVASTGAELVGQLLRVQPASVLGFATGSTQLSLYRCLIEKYRAGDISFNEVTGFNLDEYLGVAADSAQSYRAYMDREFFEHINIDRDNTHLPHCEDGQNPRLVGPRYEESILKAGGIDLQLAGIGANGHIGFNEPGSSLGSRTRVKTLTRQTLEDNSRLFSDEEFQPRLAITMGIATIMEARRVLLLATGQGKVEAVSRMVEGPVSAMCPASILQMHERVTVLLDGQAASGLRNKDYYNWAYLQNESLKDRFGD